jgi:triacylglycerol lipase
MTCDYHYDPASTPFAAGAQGYHPNNALWLAAAANLAYEDEETIRSVVQKWGFDRFRFLQGSSHLDSGGVPIPVDSQAYVCCGQEALLIAFRGTEVSKIKDWFTDLMAIAVPAPSGVGKIHKGFAAGLGAVWPQLQQALAEQYYGQVPIWITGHSLGGALATLAAAQIRFNANLPVQGLYTFGQPRVGDRIFTKFLRLAMPGRVIRFINNKDIVPQVPPPGIFLKYWHGDREARFLPEGTLIQDVSWWLRTQSLLKGSMKDVRKLGVDSFIDHSMDRYVELTRRQASAPKP